MTDDKTPDPTTHVETLDDTVTGDHADDMAAITERISTLGAGAVRRQLDESASIIAGLERARKIDELLRDADTIDLEAARLLTEVAIAGMDEADVELAVRDLKSHRPYLFKRKRTEHGSMSRRVDPAVGASDDLTDAAVVASNTGHRRDLLRYLRLRRP